MFDLNRPPIAQRIGRRFRSNMYTPVYHSNRQPIKNTIGVVMNRLVGMALKQHPDDFDSTALSKPLMNGHRQGSPIHIYHIQSY